MGKHILRKGGVAGLLQRQNGELPLPFGREIFLLQTHIAGTSHVKNIKKLAEALQPGERLDLFREPENPYDALAVLVKNKKGQKLGYLPQKQNAIFARLMDAGKQLYAEMDHQRTIDGWIKIDIRVYLRD